MTRSEKRDAFAREVAASLWGGVPESVTLVRESANIVYRFDRDGATCFLRITHIWQREKVKSAMAFLRFLVAGGAPVHRPVPSRRGRYVEDIDFQGVVWQARVYEGVLGQPLTNRCTAPTVYRAWGSAVARMHRVALEYRPHPTLYFFSLAEELAETERFLPKDDAELWTVYGRLLKWVETLPVDGLIGPFGVTHGDCNAGNFIWDGDGITIIDFDEPMWNWFAADVARPFREMSDFPLPQRTALLNAFVAGYRAVRPLPAAAVALLPDFIRLKNLSMYAWEISEGKQRNSSALQALRQAVIAPAAW